MFNINRFLSQLENFKREFESMMKILFSYFHVKIYMLVFFVVNFLIWITARYIDSEIDEPQIALHYNVESGIDYYGDINKIYILPFLGFVIFLINYVLCANFSRHKDRRFISHILLSTTVIANIILLGGIVSVYLVNFK